MVKKLKQASDKKSAAPVNLLDGEFAKTVKESAQQIWLAGLGAYSKAQEEGGKVFEALVKEGVAIQRKTQSVAEEKLNDVADKVSGLAGDVGEKAGQRWDKLESIFEDRTARALARLGVPSAKDVAALTQRVDALTAQLAKLSSKAPATKVAAKVAAKKAPAAKRATR